MPLLSAVRLATLIALFATLTASLHASPNKAESATDGEVIQLIEGAALEGWKKFGGGPPSEGWEVEDQAIHRSTRARKRAGHIYWHQQEFGDFELSWKWKIASGGNSGVKYRVKKYGGRWLGCEYQLLDDTRHKNAEDPKKRAGALYNLYATNTKKSLKAVGEFNQSRVVARGSRVEHWLNGEKILEYDTSTADWRKRVASSKFNEHPDFGQNQAGFIMLQDHGSEVWFRDIVVRIPKD